MIDLHTWTTPNGRKISIMLEECGLEYRVVPVDLGANAQFEPEFLAISPNNKIPAIVDHDAPGGAQSVFESGAILIYLAERTGQFLAAEGPARAAALEWLMFQMASIGPVFGQLNHFLTQAPEGSSAYAIERFTNESVRILGVLDGRLQGRDYVAGEYSIADMSLYPWVSAFWTAFGRMQPDAIEPFTAIGPWLDRTAARPAVARGMAVP